MSASSFTLINTALASPIKPLTKVAREVTQNAERVKRLICSLKQRASDLALGDCVEAVSKSDYFVIDFAFLSLILAEGSVPRFTFYIRPHLEEDI